VLSHRRLQAFNGGDWLASLLFHSSAVAGIRVPNLLQIAQVGKGGWVMQGSIRALGWI
jgi:hypothetical protein